MEETSGQWISASKTIQKMTNNGEDPVQIEAMLASYLRNGDLHARAKAIWEASAKFTSMAWRQRPGDAPSGPVPVAYWRYEKDITEDRKRWRFRANQFTVTKILKPRKRIMMSGVEFALDDLRRLQPKYFGLAEGKVRRGRPVDIAKRDAGWLCIVDLAIEKKLNRTTYKTQDELKSEMEDLLKRPDGALAIGKSGIAEIARQVWPRVPLAEA